MSVLGATPLLQWDTGSKVLSIAISHDGTRLVSGSFDKSIRIWDMRTGSLVLGPLKGHTYYVRSVAWSYDDTRIFSGSWDSTICIWDARAGAPIGKSISGHTRGVWSVACSPDGTRIVSSSDDNTTRIWDANTSASIGGFLRGHTSTVLSVAFSPDSTRIITGSEDQTVGIWDAQTGTPIGDLLSGHTGAVVSVAFSPNNNRVVSGSGDATIRMWDVDTGILVGEPLRGHSGTVLSVAFSPDSTRIASGSGDGTIRVWDIGTGALIGEPLRGHSDIVQSVAFSPDNTRIVSSSEDKSICVWEAPREAPTFDTVTSNMSVHGMFESLVRHGCTDLSSDVDPARYSASAIAFGGFGDVWQAWMNNGILVVIKCLRLHLVFEGDQKNMKRATRELYHWSKARHENIQELLGIIMFQGRLGMVSLWMENGHLQQYIKKNPSVERYPLCVQVTKGVAYLHDIGMVHGDLKASNILVSAGGIVKISDFDHSIFSESTLRFSETSKAGGGTSRWMAPELLLDQEEDGPPVTRNTTTDVYALGMTILEIISGNVPYHQCHSDVGVIHLLIKRKTPKRPQELSGADNRGACVWALLTDCWDHDPSARPHAPSVLTSLQNFTI